MCIRDRVGDLKLLAHVEADARRLLSVAEGGIEEDDRDAGVAARHPGRRNLIDGPGVAARGRTDRRAGGGRVCWDAFGGAPGGGRGGYTRGVLGVWFGCGHGSPLAMVWTCLAVTCRKAPASHDFSPERGSRRRRARRRATPSGRRGEASPRALADV